MVKRIIYDIGIVGSGISGAFAAYRALEYGLKNKIIMFDIGRPPKKRRRQLEGWLGCMPGGDGKINLDDVSDVAESVDGRKLRHVKKWVLDILKDNGPIANIKTKALTPTTKNKIINAGWEIKQHNYFQWRPEYIHKLSKYIADEIEDKIDVSFDNEVTQILKKGKEFLVVTDYGDYYCRNILLCAGRTGWRWATELYKSFGILEYNDIASYGICAELTSSYLKEYNKNYLSLFKNDLEVGPLYWNGTIIPEDHADLAISAFRSNEDRWKTDKVSFNIIGKKIFENHGVQETDRLAKLAYLLFNDRIGKEKIREIIRGTSPLSQLKEYNWLVEAIEEVDQIIPGLILHGSYHAPTIHPLTGEINITKNFETDINGLYVAGESAGYKGILAAAITGVLAIDGVIR